MKILFNRPSKHNGFSLIELMVGMTIGLIVTLVVAQVFGTFEGQQRATSGTADAQTNGSIALYNISRELQMAGYGVMPSNDSHSPLECNSISLGTEATTNGNMVATDGINSLSAVTINNGVASDKIIVRYGDSLFGGIPTTLTAAASGQILQVGSNLNCKDGDFVIITRGTDCAVTRLADPKTSTANSLTELVIKSSETMPALVTAGGSSISCLGNWTRNVFEVRNGVLTLNGDDLISGVVILQAQYGVSDSPNDNKITKWVDPVPVGGENWGATGVGLRNRIKAVRVAVVARNPKKERKQVSMLCSSTTAANPTGVCAWEGTAASPAPSIDLTSLGADWKYYRYRVFETIIPLRNVIWSKDTL